MTTLAAKNVQARGNILSGIDRILSMPRAKVYRTTASTTTAGLSYNTSFEGVEYDSDGMWNSAQPSRLTVKTAGLWLLNGSAQYNAAVNEQCWTRIVLNGSTSIASATQFGMGGSFGTHQLPTGFWPAKAGDFFELWLLTNLNAAGIFTGQYSLYLQACMISAIP